jgi:hypothetical protein
MWEAKRGRQAVPTWRTAKKDSTKKMEGNSGLPPLLITGCCGGCGTEWLLALWSYPSTSGSAAQRMGPRMSLGPVELRGISLVLFDKRERSSFHLLLPQYRDA